MKDEIREILDHGVSIGVVKAGDVEWMVKSCPSQKAAREHVGMMRQFLARLSDAVRREW